MLMGIRSKIYKIKRFLGNHVFYRNLFYNVNQYRKLRKPPVIICGCPRSGTSLLMSILDSHPEIHVIPFETALFQNRPLQKRVFKGTGAHFLFTKFQLRLYLFSGVIKQTAVMWCEKTPLNILNVQEIDKLFNGRVKFIYIYRDGRDVVASFHHRFGFMVSPQLWEKCVIAGKCLGKKTNFFTIKYEDLVQNPKIAMAEVQSFLSLSLEFEMEDWLDRTSVKGFMNSPVNDNLGASIISAEINVNSIGKWKNSDSPFVPEFLSNPTCMMLNRSLGYH